MSRTKSAPLPSLRVAGVEGVEDREPVIVPIKEPEPQAKSVKLEVLVSTVEVPHLPMPENSASNYQDDAHRCDMGNLTRERLRKVQAMRRAYIGMGKVFANGKQIKSNADALNYFLDTLNI